MSTDIQVVLPGVRTKRIIPQRKLDYAKKLREMLEDYSTCLIVTVDNFGSRNIAEMRKDFRGRARFLFGKNTLIRKIIRDYMKETNNKGLNNLLDCVKGNCGFCFTKGDIKELRHEILNRKVQCPAKAGAIAPCDVSVHPGPTGMEPTQTTFFQSMNIATRINKVQIDIVDEVHLIKQGFKVGASEASLLMKLNIKPFYYAMKVRQIYENGTAYEASILDITGDQIAQSLYSALHNVAAFCFSLNYPTIINVPHSLMNAYKQVLSLGLSLESYSWEQLDTVKTALKNPGAFAAAAPTATTTAQTGAQKPQVKEEPKELSEKPSSGKAKNMFDEEDSDS